MSTEEKNKALVRRFVEAQLEKDPAAQALDSTSPGEVLERVNETLLARIPANKFVTCFYAILEPESASLSYAMPVMCCPTCGMVAMQRN